MANGGYKFIWRCAKCSNHFINIIDVDGGRIKQEKKCPKCKALNILIINNKDISIQCKLYDPDTNGYERLGESHYPQPEF